MGAPVAAWPSRGHGRGRQGGGGAHKCGESRPAAAAGRGNKKREVHESSSRGDPLASEVLRWFVMLQRHRNGVSTENLRSSPTVSTARRSGRKGIAGLLRRPGHGGLSRSTLWLAALSTAGCCCVLWLLFSWYSVTSPRSDDRARLSTDNPHDFQGASRTANNPNKPRIAIISNAVAFPYNADTTALWSLFKEYFANKDCYANTHGYDLIIDSRYSNGSTTHSF